VVHSIELTLDAAADAAVRDLWRAIAETAVRSQSAHRSPTNRPHVTLTVAAQMSDAVASDLAPVAAGLPLACRLGAPMIFGRGPYTLVLLVIPSAGLLDLHAQVNRICLPHMSSGPLGHTVAGQWTPHVTLARRVDAGLLERALGAVCTGADIEGAFAGLRHWDGDARQEHPISLSG